MASGSPTATSTRASGGNAHRDRVPRRFRLTADPLLRADEGTGDLGNISLGPGSTPFKKTYILANLNVSDLYGRSVIQQ